MQYLIPYVLWCYNMLVRLYYIYCYISFSVTLFNILTIEQQWKKHFISFQLEIFAYIYKKHDYTNDLFYRVEKHFNVYRRVLCKNLIKIAIRQHDNTFNSLLRIYIYSFLYQLYWRQKNMAPYLPAQMIARILCVINI